MNKLSVSILDYGMGNLFSVQQACHAVGLEAKLIREKDEILSADALIVPGVGAFGDAVSLLSEKGLIEGLIDFIGSGRPFMGICLGLQILFSESEEFGLHKGLGIFPGRIVRFNPGSADIKVPQTGWNRIYLADGYNDWKDTGLDGVENGQFMYFVHSFYASPVSGENVIAVSEYAGIKYCAALKKDNVFACQFHPEKSACAGLEIYRNFKRTLNNSKERK